MLIVSPSTATAIAPHARSKSWVMFVQTSLPTTCGQGLILIEGARGGELADRIKTHAKSNAYELTLIGLIESQKPGEHARAIVEQYTTHVHDGWCEPTASLLAFIQHVAQPALVQLLQQVHPGAVSNQTVGTEEIAAMLGVSEITIRRMVAAGQIPYLKTGRLYRFVPTDVIATLRRGR